MLGVLPYSLVKIYAPAFYALDRPRIPMLASMAAVAVQRGLQQPGLAAGWAPPGWPWGPRWRRW